MYQTGYLPLQSIGKAPGDYVGGFCRWWYTPIENILYFPGANPQTQRLINEPILKAGTSWYGPVNVPDEQTGWREKDADNKAGTYYKEEVTGFIPGAETKNHINLGNLAHHRFCVVGKLRAGSFYLIIGNEFAGLRLSHESGSGKGSMDTPGTAITFTGDFDHKAQVLSDFSGGNAIAPPAPAQPFTAYWFASSTNAAVNDSFITALTTKGVFADNAKVIADLRYNTAPMFLNVAIPVGQPLARAWNVSPLNYGLIGPGNLFKSPYKTTTGGFNVYTTAYKTAQTQSPIQLIS